jgi:dihydroorotate dehydrogenase
LRGRRVRAAGLIMLYDLARPLLFTLDAERAHDLTFSGLEIAAGCRLSRLLAPAVPDAPLEVMGLTFRNPVGLAAGLDKNGAHIDALAALGFGFIEVGTVTPRPQPGNPTPRLFRIPEARALINRMGFNNFGVDRLVANVSRARYRGVLGINIGKNFDTPIERAVDDYLICLRKVYAHAGYVAVNISSPNTQNLRSLQQAPALERLLSALAEARARLAAEHRRRVPLAIKIAPDLDAAGIADIARLAVEHEMDAIIATNTTLARDGVEGLRNSAEPGGLSGAPLKARSTAVVGDLARVLSGRLPIIGAGGIVSGGDAVEKITAGASLVQVYTGLVYRGPALVGEIAKALSGASAPARKSEPALL